jgi:hypothetical protein
LGVDRAPAGAHPSQRLRIPGDERLGRRARGAPGRLWCDGRFTPLLFVPAAALIVSKNTVGLLNITESVAAAVVMIRMVCLDQTAIGGTDFLGRGPRGYL